MLLYIILLHMILLHVMCFAVDMQHGPSLGHHQYVCISWYRTGRITSDNNCTRKRRCKKGALIAVDDQGDDGDEDYCRFSCSFGQHGWVKHVSFRDVVSAGSPSPSPPPPRRRLSRKKRKKKRFIDDEASCDHSESESELDINSDEEQNVNSDWADATFGSASESDAEW